ncbi:NAD(P)-binding protein [Heliocybe sulcata]|uniref:NAD(P)-binding protein n=1 Tax=Heliocybe sulcata TaxID=5364 RepID=A0A5C3MM93_9AGAM|nr:NAD(P)-binding protein [Heliocybe sulcata]
MPSLSAVRASNAAFKPSYIPVALFVGGTSGVGQALAKAFACITNGNAHIILCGRNKAAAESIIASFPKPTSNGSLHEFVECDVTLMKNIQKTTSGLRSRSSKLNFLVLSPGVVSMAGRTETEEGIDRKMALHYYARWKFTNDLMPLLKKAKDAGEEASVMSILGPGRGGPMDVNDLGLKDTYTVANAAKAANTYNDLMMESFAEQNPGIGFTHMHPGGVRTDILKNSQLPMKSLLELMAYPFTTAPEDAAQFMLHSLLEGGRQGGLFRRNPKAEDIGREKLFGGEEERKKLWEHTVEVPKVG